MYQALFATLISSLCYCYCPLFITNVIWVFFTRVQFKKKLIQKCSFLRYIRFVRSVFFNFSRLEHSMQLWNKVVVTLKLPQNIDFRRLHRERVSSCKTNGSPFVLWWIFHNILWPQNDAFWFFSSSDSFGKVPYLWIL